MSLIIERAVTQHKMANFGNIDYSLFGTFTDSVGCIYRWLCALRFTQLSKTTFVSAINEH